MNKEDTDLRALQRRFQDYLTGASEEFENDIMSSENALATHRLAAYYNAYRIRLIESLATDYPGLHKELGEEGFELMVLDYLNLYPSEHPSIRWVGQHLSGFLQQSAHADRLFLSELAAFEWTQSLCFDAANTEQLLTLEQMAQVDAESWPFISFSFDPSVRWLDLHCNVAPYWVALDEDTPLPPKNEDEIPVRWLLWRKDFKPHWRSLDVTEAWAIQAAMNGASFSELCEGLLEWLGEEVVAVTAAGYLKQWIHDELISRIVQPVD